jgi:hypothetical protein
MILAVDVAYTGTTATVRVVLFHCWTDARSEEEELISWPVPDTYRYIYTGKFLSAGTALHSRPPAKTSQNTRLYYHRRLCLLVGEEKPGCGKYI